MFKKEFVINTIDNVKKFVNVTTSCIEDMDLVRGRYVIDAKSILGIFSLDFSQPAELRVHTEDEARANQIFRMIEEALRG